MRQESRIRSYAVTHGPGPVRFPQDSAWHQFVHASTGVVRLDTDDGAWTLPRHRALWVAAGVEHTATVVQRAAMRVLYLPVDARLMPDRVAVVEVTPLVRELVAHLAASAPVELDERGEAWLTVLSEQVRALDVAPVRLPLPRREPAVSVVAQLRADPAGADDVDSLARQVGASRRTVERAFRDELGMTVGEWRRRLRLLVALESLAAGEPVGRVAADAGYATQSAFGAMFKAHFGTSPGTYFDR